MLEISNTADLKKITTSENSVGVFSSQAGSLAGAVSNIFSTGVNAFSPKVRENNLAIAQAQADMAKANATASQNVNTIDPKVIYGGLGLVALLLVIFFIARK